MICDYYLFNVHIKSFEDWDKEKEKKKEDKYKLWLEEVFAKPLTETKRKIQSKLKETKNTEDFYPKPADLQNLLENSVLTKISFTLKKPYLSKDEGEFFENPIVRDKFTGLPMVRPSTWKGHLRFAAEKVEWKETDKKKIIKRLFGSESGEIEALKGRLYFFPTFFEEEAEKDVITPLKRGTRTPARGPISLEVMKPGSKGEFYLLYVPYPKGKDFKEEQIEKDLEFLAEALKLMFYTYGFSAKKTLGFGVIEKLKEENVEVYPENKRNIFSVLYTKVNNIVNQGE